MASTLQSSWRSASVPSSQKPIADYEPSNLDSTIESPWDEVTKAGKYAQKPPTQNFIGTLWHTDEGGKAQIRR
jgi:hypothetical protein